MNSVRSKEDLPGFSKRRLYGKSLVSSFRFFLEIDRFQVMSSRCQVRHRVPKCDVIENEICEIMGFVKLF